MLSNEVVARARQLVGEHVLENLLAVGSCFQSKCMTVHMGKNKKTSIITV